MHASCRYTTYRVYSFYTLEWFYDRRIAAKRTTTHLTRRVLSIFQKNSDDSKFYFVEPVDNVVYYVKGGIKDRVVNLNNKTVHVVGLTSI